MSTICRSTSSFSARRSPGRRRGCSVKASLKLAADPTALSLNANINRLDQPGQIALDLGYAPDQNQLKVDIKASEPQGGLVATLLNIPDRPAIDLTVNGSGPLSNFMANGALTVGSEQAASLTARVDAVDAGRRVSASLSVAAARFVPAQYQRYVAGGANLDAQVVVANDGTYQIEQGTLTSDAISLAASGTLDPNGSANDLSVKLTSRDGSPISYAFGTAPNAGSVSLENLQASLSGALANAELSATASVPSARFGDYAAEGLDATVEELRLQHQLRDRPLHSPGDRHLGLGAGRRRREHPDRPGEHHPRRRTDRHRADDQLQPSRDRHRLGQRHRAVPRSTSRPSISA